MYNADLKVAIQISETQELSGAKQAKRNFHVSHMNMSNTQVSFLFFFKEF